MTSSGNCYPCEREQEFAALPPRENITWDAWWRVAHAFGTSLPGWLVLLPRRHVTAVPELTEQEAAVLGLWQVRLSRALQAVTGCAKTYVVAFGEAEGFAHVHFHVIPRMPDLAGELQGPGIFGRLGVPGDEQVTDPAQDELALALRRELTGDPWSQAGLRS